MSGSRLERQLAFLVEADKLKRVLRQNLVGDGSRRENVAEHSWHLTLAALVLAEHCAEGAVDLGRVMRMVVLHDLVEIDAGDTYLYDARGRVTKQVRERQAAERLFGLLPGDQAEPLSALWEEFEARETAEARYAGAVDRLLPMLLNYLAEGRVWKVNGITRAQIVEHCEHMKDGAPELWKFAQSMLDDAVAKGFLPADCER
jgi:putative hydrolases of HD superfamily